jgi:DNA-binding MarR family transcriptional regulator
MASTATGTSEPEIQAHRYDEFIESFAHLVSSSRGLPMVAGRLFAYLLVCEPAEQTAAQLSQAVGASLGTISGMTRLLIGTGLIERTRRRGERSAVYRVPPDGWRTVTKGQIEGTRYARELTDRGLSLMTDRPAASRSRLQDLRDIYLFFESSIPALFEQWEQRRREDTA